MKRRTKYDMVKNKFERKAEKLRTGLEREIKPIIKTLAISVGVDMESTQHSCYVTDNRYSERELDENSFTRNTNKKFNPFVDMLYFFSDELKISFYFQIENGKFKWW